MTVFEETSIFDLLDKDTARLGSDLVSKRELELKTGDRTSIHSLFPIETRYIGVIAGFRQVDVAQWRSSIVLAPGSARLC